jgi:TonB-dependent SusC/RagA subfamily outer membrane receptor
MSPLFIYLLKASATVFILWAFYALCLRRMTFHRLNRYFFLGGILISMIWPLLPLTEWFSNAPQVNQVIIYIPVSALMMQFKPETPVFGFEMAFKILYFGGITFMVVRLMIQIVSLRAIFKKSEVRVINGVKVRVVNEKINPFSFFGYIFLNPENHSPAELSAIILHEKIHETSTHSVDILLSEFFKILLWFNPFSWLFCRAVKENIEFEVDRVLLHQGIDCKEYQYSLLKLSSVKNQIVITNHFNLSNLKTRIIMMNKNQSSRYGLAAYALVIPLILMCMVFSYAFAQDKPIIDTVKSFTFVQQKPEKTPDNALIILDGKVIDKATMDAMNSDDIYSVNVLKGKSATDIYGRKGKNGVVLITSKKPGTEKKTFITYRVTDSLGSKNGSNPTIYIDDKEVTEAEMKEFDPDKIMSVNVMKNDFETRQLGDKKGNGTIRIITKKMSTAGSGEGSGTSFSTSSSSSSDGKTQTIVVTSKGNGEGSSGKTFTVTSDGNKKTLEKDVVVTGYGPDKGDSKYIIINTDSNTKDGKTVTNKMVNVLPDNVHVVIDGVPGKIGDVKPENIESIEILKGDAVKAIYGEKGANGVIIITTKTGGKSVNKDKK